MTRFRRITPLVVTLLAGSLLAACGLTSVPPPSVTITGPAKTAMPAALAKPKEKNQEYVIGAGDSLSIFVYHNPDLSEPGVAVRPDGRISTPLINDIVAAGRTPTELAKDIEARLKKYIRDPIVTVIVRSFVGPSDRQIKVIGEATHPEAIPYRDGMSLLDVMIATGGLTKFAAGNRAMIVRRLSGGRQEIIHVHLNDLLKNGDLTQNVAMRPGDTLIIPESWF